MEVTIERIADELKRYNEFRIYYHHEPDGDAIGTASALGLALKSLGAKCEALCDSVPDKKLYREIVNRYEWDKTEKAVNIAVDSTNVGRLGKYSDIKVDFCIDHHDNNTIDADYKYVDPRASSCAEVIYKIIKAMGVNITPEIADLLFIGLITDTNCFRSSSVTPESYSVAGLLAECGADTVGLTKKIYMTLTPGKVEFDRRFGNGITYAGNGKIACAIFTLKDQEEIGEDFGEIFDVKSRTQQIDGVEIGVTILEKKPGCFKASIHTNTYADAKAICEELGGGGHIRRAGTGVLTGSPEEVKEKVISVCERHLN